MHLRWRKKGRSKPRLYENKSYELLARPAVFGGVVQTNFAAGALLGGVDDAGIEGAGIDVEADCALVEFAGIENAMNWSERVNGAGLRHIHLNDFGGMDRAFAGSDVLMHNVEIFDL